MDERDRGQGSLSDKVKGSYRRVSVVMYVTLVIAAIAVFAAAYVPKQFSLAYTILVLIVFLITAVNDTRLIQRNSQKIVDAVVEPVTELTKGQRRSRREIWTWKCSTARMMSWESWRTVSE